MCLLQETGRGRGRADGAEAVMYEPSMVLGVWY